MRELESQNAQQFLSGSLPPLRRLSRRFRPESICSIQAQQVALYNSSSVLGSPPFLHSLTLPTPLALNSPPQDAAIAYYYRPHYQQDDDALHRPVSSLPLLKGR